MFGRKDNPAPADPDVVKLIRDIGRMEARMESIELQWVAYRDELKRLATRLEKRDQRAQARDEAAQAAQVGLELTNGHHEASDAISALVFERRNRGVRRPQTEG